VNLQSDELTVRVCSILVSYADSPDLRPESIEPSAPVFGPAGIITDSLRVLDALCDIEATLDITIPDEDLTEDLFASVNNLSRYLGSRVLAMDDR
jgi:acyl carrier protein